MALFPHLQQLNSFLCQTCPVFRKTHFPFRSEVAITRREASKPWLTSSHWRWSNHITATKAAGKTRVYCVNAGVYKIWRTFPREYSLPFRLSELSYPPMCITCTLEIYSVCSNVCPLDGATFSDSVKRSKKPSGSDHPFYKFIERLTTTQWFTYVIA